MLSNMDNLKSSTDIWFCAYLQLKGVKLNNYQVISKGKVRCFFNVSDEEWQKQRVDFNNSELSRYKILVEQIKDLAY